MYVDTSEHINILLLDLCEVDPEDKGEAEAQVDAPGEHAIGHAPGRGREEVGDEGGGHGPAHALPGRDQHPPVGLNILQKMWEKKRL